MPPLIPDARARLRALIGVQGDRAVVVFMSRVHPKKGIELLLEAAAAVSPPFDLVIVGSGEAKYLAELKRKAADRLAGRIHWFGFKEGDEKWCALQGADLFVLPSYSENFGIAVLEAIACGVPVVISDQVALQDEVKKHNLGLVVPLDIPKLTDSMQALLNDSAGRAEISARAVAKAEDCFSWHAASRSLIAAYRANIPTT